MGRRSLDAIRDLAWGWGLAFNSNRRLALSWLLLSTASGLAPMVLLLSVRRALFGLTGSDAAAPDAAAGPLGPVLMLVLGATATVYLLNALAKRLRGRLVAGVQTTVLDRLLGAVNAIPVGFFDTRGDQDLLHRARTDAVAQPAVLFEASATMLQTGLFFGAIAIYLALHSWVYPALLLAASAPAVAIFGVATALAHRTRRRDTFLQRLAAYLLWALTNRTSIPEIRVTGFERSITARHADVRERLDRSERLRERNELIAALTAGIGMLASIGIGVWWMLGQYQAGLIPMGDLAIGFYAFLIAHRMAGVLLESAARLYRGGLFLGDLRQLLSLPPATHRGKSAPAPAIREGIGIQNIRFAYPGMSELVFEALSLEIPAGEITLLTGPNGRGKSTLLKLIAGLYAPSRGQILVDGTPLDQIDLTSWQKQIGFMFQSPVSFPGQLRENVDLDRRVTDEARKRALAFGQLDDLLAKLPQGDGTPLLRALGGHDLSAGEWQRVALARAIANDPPLLILDEPTSSLDPASRQRFWKMLPEFARGRTVLVASHDADAVGKRIELEPPGSDSTEHAPRRAEA